jgi:N-acyl-D-amino-acid deacylase
MTSQAASAFGFEGVGLVREGFRANLVVFDPAVVTDRATFEDPLQFASGVRDVIVGGTLAVRDEAVTGGRGGKIIK